MERYQELLHKQWKDVFYDSGKEDYNAHWFKDGQVASIINDENGMLLKQVHYSLMMPTMMFYGQKRFLKAI